LRHLADDWGTVLGAAALLAAAGGAFYWLRRRTPDPEEIERLRRSHLNQIGRIVEGHVVELLETPPEPPASRGLFRKQRAAPSGAAENGRKLVCYSYSISGVSYETAQDITGLEERLRPDRLVAGQSASVKYDPSNPSDSILVAEDWSGLH
jgi:hypothetical protein